MSGGQGIEGANARVRSRIAAWRETNAWLKGEEQWARENPRAFVLIFEPYVLRQRRHIRRFLLNRFGVKFNYRIHPEKDRRPGLFGKPRLAFPERFPTGFRHRQEDLDLFRWFRVLEDMLYWFDGAHTIIVSARFSALKEGADPDAAVVENVFEYHRMGPWMSRPTAQAEADPWLREHYAENLAGWVGSRVSLGPNRRLRSILQEEGIPSERLVEELLSTTIIAYDDMMSEAPPANGADGRKRSLMSRAERLLENLGTQDAKLARGNKLADRRPGSEIPDAEDGIEEVERRETSRQQLEALNSLVERAAFSEQETRVFDLDMATDHDTDAIAHGLNLKAATVRVYRKRYRKKLREASSDSL